MATTVRVDEKVHLVLRELSAAQHRPIGQVIEDAVMRYQKEQFWQEVEASVERLRADPAAWEDYQQEIALLEGGSLDGVTEDDPYFTAAELEEIRAELARTQGR